MVVEGNELYHNSPMFILRKLISCSDLTIRLSYILDFNWSIAVKDNTTVNKKRNNTVGVVNEQYSKQPMSIKKNNSISGGNLTVMLSIFFNFNGSVTVKDNATMNQK